MAGILTSDVIAELNKRVVLTPPASKAVTAGAPAGSAGFVKPTVPSRRYFMLER